jgi:glutathione S-transferase
MINLGGLAFSNYSNKIKLVLLEKGIAFSEEQVFPSQDEAFLQRSPLGKIPFIETEHGVLTESQVILEYLEEQYPETPLYPADVFARAKCRELINQLELNVELHAHRLVRAAFFGGAASDEVKADVYAAVEKGLIGVNRLAKFAPYIAGDSYSVADCVAWLHFSMISLICQKIYREDLVAKHIPHISQYMQLIEQRPAAQKVAADRAAAMAAFLK